MTPTATEILDHCKAVVNGEIPQPLPFWLVADSDGLERPQYVFYYAKPTDGEADHVALILWGFPNQIQVHTLQLAARLLGLDRPSPAPVVLEWVETKMSEYCSHCAHFNNLIEAYISTDENGNVRTAPRIYVNGSRVSEMHSFDNNTLSEARAWCAKIITEIITPKQ